MCSTTHKFTDKMTALSDKKKKITFYHKSDICSFNPNLGIYYIFHEFSTSIIEL